MQRKSPPRPLILRNSQSPGDVLMLTAAVRDLHRHYPGQFLTAVATSADTLWQHNPHVFPLAAMPPGVEEIVCEYPLIHQSNTAPWHFVHAFHQDLGRKLNLALTPTEFRGDIHLSPQEKSWMSQVEELTRQAMPFWILVAGGKFDFTAKWWDPRRLQAVVDHFRGRILFVQVGEGSHHHPDLNGVLDLRGKTDTRQLVRLMYHAQGAVSPVTFVMHLAAAVETRPPCAAYPRGMPKNRPGVVIAGGREPAQWEAYPHHQYIHTNGALLCCDHGGCWKSRVVPLGDGDEKDRNLCLDVVELASGRRLPGEEWARLGIQAAPLDPAEPARTRSVDYLPRCLDMITADEVIRRIESYFAGGAVEYLSPAQAAVCRETLSLTGW